MGIAMVERFLNDADRNAEYVGDGAYVVDTGEGIRIFTSNGVEEPTKSGSIWGTSPLFVGSSIFTTRNDEGVRQMKQIKPVEYSPMEQRVFLVLRKANGSPLTAERIAARSYKKKEAPYHAIKITSMTLKDLAKKLDQNEDIWQLKKSTRRGPYPIDFWLEKR